VAPTGYRRRTCGTGYTEYQAQAKAAIEKYRQEKQAKQARPEVGRRVEFWANQAWRDGEVLATIEDRALIAYRMPAGAVYMVIVAHDPNTGPLSDSGGTILAASGLPLRQLQIDLSQRPEEECQVAC
jgi:hypothetical protein